MSAEKTRVLVKEAYKKSEGWAARVDRMTDDQVFAIYIRLKAQGLIKA